MESSFWRRFTPSKLHTRTTILTTGVLAAVFAVTAYFWAGDEPAPNGQPFSAVSGRAATRVARFSVLT